MENNDRADGNQHCGVLPDPRDIRRVGVARHHESLWARFQPPDILGLVALAGLLIYSLLYRMEGPVVPMLTGLLGMLAGRQLQTGRFGNGNGKPHGP